jgi:hypothetical protein
MGMYITRYSLRKIVHIPASPLFGFVERHLAENISDYLLGF